MSRLSISSLQEKSSISDRMRQKGLTFAFIIVKYRLLYARKCNLNEHTPSFYKLKIIKTIRIIKYHLQDVILCCSLIRIGDGWEVARQESQTWKQAFPELIAIEHGFHPDEDGVTS